MGIVVSASPLKSLKRQDESYHECMNPDGKRFFMYNKEGKPSPDDLQVATERKQYCPEVRNRAI